MTGDLEVKQSTLIAVAAAEIRQLECKCDAAPNFNDQYTGRDVCHRCTALAWLLLDPNDSTVNLHQPPF